MLCRSLATLAGAVALIGCTHASPGRSGSLEAGGSSPPLTTDEQRMLACLDLRDHIVDLYATQYVSAGGSAMTAAERTAFRDEWAEELAKRGTFERFEQSCFSGLTPRRYSCGMQSQTTGSLAACMRLTAN